MRVFESMIKFTPSMTNNHPILRRSFLIHRTKVNGLLFLQDQSISTQTERRSLLKHPPDHWFDTFVDTEELYHLLSWQLSGISPHFPYQPLTDNFFRQF